MYILFLGHNKDSNLFNLHRQNFWLVPWLWAYTLPGMCYRTWRERMLLSHL